MKIVCINGRWHLMTRRYQQWLKGKRKRQVWLKAMQRLRKQELPRVPLR